MSAGFFVLRAPLLSFDDLTAWSADLQAPDAVADPAQLGEALETDRARLRARLAAIVVRPEVREALFLASPSLEEALEVWLRDPEGDRGQRVERALVRYVARMAGRATPFGLFAGCAVGDVADETRLALGRGIESHRHTRFDSGYLVALAEALGRDPALRRSFVYRPNSSLYRAAGWYRYVEARVEGTARSYQLVALDVTTALEATLTRATSAAGFDELAAALVDDEVTREDAETFVSELIDGQVLVPDAEAPVTGPDRLVERLSARPATAAIAERLDAARCVLAAMDAEGPGVSPDRYRSLARTLDDGYAKADLSRLFQVDLVRAAPEISLGRDVVEEIAAGVRLLHQLSRAGEDPRLRRFREAFTTRYEAREVRLVEALDEELGVGFEVAAETSPLLRGLDFASAPAEAPRWTERDDALFETLAEALARGRREIVLDEASVQRMAAAAPLPLPPTFSVIATIAATSIAAVTGGDFRVWLKEVEGPSGAELLGRFCQADLALHRRVEALLRAEELHDPEAVFAEIVHLPAGRLGNILRRPVLRGHEIPYLGSSGADADCQILITDLLVSVRAEQIVLRSARLGRRVLPRLTSRHNWESATLGMYRFLCALQAQGTAGNLAWNWGPLAAAPFLPRVTAGRAVFARARWRVGKDQLRRLGAATGAARYRAVQEWRAERGLARFVVLADGDNRLPIDLDNTLAVEAFVHGAKGREEAVVEEAWPAPDALCVEGPEGRFVHELVVPFVRTADAVAPRPATRHAASAPLPRSFPPGSQWLFVKVYTGVATADDVLIEKIAPVARRMLASRAADRWFFARYGDPDWHLRVRFHGDPAALQRLGWPALRDALAPLIDDGRAWRVSLDTYDRETERYGGAEGVELAERVFHADSDAVVAILALLDPGYPGLDVRWRLALSGMAQLLDDLCLDLAARAILLRHAREALAREFRVDRALRRQLGERWERERADVARLLDPARDDEHPLAPALAVLRARSARIRPVAEELRRREATNRLTVPVRELAASFLHMHANRLLRSAGPQQELVLYDFLVRLYEGEMHRARA